MNRQRRFGKNFLFREDIHEKRVSACQKILEEEGSKRAGKICDSLTARRTVLISANSDSSPYR